MNTVVDEVISRDGTPIAYQQSGSGPAIVLVGGAFCDRNFAAPLAELLVADFTVISYDRRGRGDSGDTLPYAVAREVEDLGALIAAVGGSAYLFGVSSGAILCFEAAADGLPVSGLGLVEPPYPVDDSHPIPNFADQYTELCGAGRRGDAVALFMTKAVGQPPEAVDQARATPMWPALEAMAHTLAYDAMVTAEGLPSAERAASVTVPALGIGSTSSPPWLRGGAEAIAQPLPHGQYLELEGEFHAPRPDLVAKELRRSFLGR
jgi:pimeloyl-ACP methyl ester carboxylesterase